MPHPSTQDNPPPPKYPPTKKDPGTKLSNMIFHTENPIRLQNTFLNHDAILQSIYKTIISFKLHNHKIIVFLVNFFLKKNPKKSRKKTDYVKSLSHNPINNTYIVHCHSK